MELPLLVISYPIISRSNFFGEYENDKEGGRKVVHDFEALMIDTYLIVTATCSPQVCTDLDT